MSSFTARSIASIRSTMGGVGVVQAAKAKTSAPRFVFDRPVMDDPKQLQIQLNRLAELAMGAHVIGASNLLAGSLLTEPMSVVAGTTIQILHGLGHAPYGWFGVSSTPNAFVATQLDLPAGLHADAHLWLRSSVTTTTRILIF